jgi:hypothetical protein
MSRQRHDRRASEQRDPTARAVRRALEHVGGPARTVAPSESLRRALEAALDVEPDDAATRAHVHGFHSYAARLHPVTASRLIATLSDRSDWVCDPFSGSGTVLVEARLLGRPSVGTDLNPLAVRLALLKTRGTSAAERAALVDAATEVAAHAEHRRRTKAGPSKRYGTKDRELFDVHVLLELDGLMQAISHEPAGFVRDTLELVLSSILVKVSRKPGDTADEIVPRRLAGGFTIRLFQKKAEELAVRLEEFVTKLPPGAPPSRVEVDDARRLATVPDEKVSLVVTSPPYPGVYDYAKQHELRMRFLGMKTDVFERGEIGARRHFDGLTFAAAVAAWEGELSATLAAIRRTLTLRGRIVMILADSVIAGRVVAADEVVSRVAPSAGLELIAAAYQERPHFHRESRRAFSSRPRQEHAFVLAKR